MRVVIYKHAGYQDDGNIFVGGSLLVMADALAAMPGPAVITVQPGCDQRLAQSGENNGADAEGESCLTRGADCVGGCVDCCGECAVGIGHVAKCCLGCGQFCGELCKAVPACTWGCLKWSGKSIWDVLKDCGEWWEDLYKCLVPDAIEEFQRHVNERRQRRYAKEAEEGIAGSRT